MVFEFHCVEGSHVELNSPLFSVASPETIAALRKRFRAQVADADGSFEPMVTFGSKVLEGDPLGTLESATVVSRYTGMITEVAAPGVVRRGELLFKFDPPASEPSHRPPRAATVRTSKRRINR